ncbi:8.9 kDa basic protein [Dasychira pudibunda nucleopolyhedrovirus]|nr:8.9 kDa basic protein [Dasychira pudibunda nucleopolyhedrovirus]
MNSWQKIRMAKQQQQLRVARQHRAAKLGRLYKARKLRAELCEKLELQRVNNDAALAKAFEEEFVYPNQVLVSNTLEGLEGAFDEELSLENVDAEMAVGTLQELAGAFNEDFTLEAFACAFDDEFVMPQANSGGDCVMQALAEPHYLHTLPQEMYDALVAHLSVEDYMNLFRVTGRVSSFYSAVFDLNDECSFLEGAYTKTKVCVYYDRLRSECCCRELEEDGEYNLYSISSLCGHFVRHFFEIADTAISTKHQINKVIFDEPNDSLEDELVNRPCGIVFNKLSAQFAKMCEKYLKEHNSSKDFSFYLYTLNQY